MRMERKRFLKAGFVIGFAQSLTYLFDVNPTAKRTYITGNDDKLPHFKVKKTIPKFFFFI